MTQRPLLCEGKKRKEAAEKMLKELQDSGVSILLNDFTLDLLHDEELSIPDVFYNNDFILKQAFYSINNLMV